MKLQLLLVFALMFAFSFDAVAVNSAVLADIDNTTVTAEKDNSNLNVFKKIGNWFKMKKAKLTSWVMKKLMAIDFDDPKSVIKLAIICWLAGLLIYITGFFVSFLWYVGYLLMLAGTVLFWYWVYLKFIK